ncbi:small acid-soluble spore protein H [Bacillus tianshenii]|nr:small acid-soluble spore protein H [Bacillus tianshenii]
MDARRAQSIAEAPEMINVTYNGKPIYIQHVDEKSEMVRIFPLGQPEREEEVPVQSLKEES